MSGSKASQIAAEHSVIWTCNTCLCKITNGEDLGRWSVDSGAICRQCLEASPARKDDSNKFRFDLMPARPLEELARVFTIGARKYGDRNWEKGLAWGRVFGAMMRHAWAFWRGESHDPVDKQHHLASVAWCALVLMEYEQTHPELDDRPWTPKSTEAAPRESNP